MLEALTGPARWATAALAFFAFLTLEGLQVPRHARPRRRSVRWQLNGVLALAGMALGRALAGFGPVAAAIAAKAEGIGLLNAVPLPVPVAWAIGLITLDLAIYLQHRAMHHLPWLWRLHRLHHTDPTLDVTSAYRFHPFEIIGSLLWKATVAVALGIPPEAVALYEILLALGAAFTHADITLPPWLDKSLRLIVATPAVHERHHGVAVTDQQSNYSGTLTLWDRLFGTWRAPAGAGTGTLGVEGTSAAQAGKLLQGLADPFKR